MPVFTKPAFAGTDELPVKDEPYTAPVSVKYTLSPKWKDIHLRKVVADGDNSIFILTDAGLFRDFPEEVISKDLRYASLSDKYPVDICIQEGTGYLYYLYSDRFLTNKHAGTICGMLPENNYRHIAVNANDDVLLTGEHGGVLYNRSTKVRDLCVPPEELIRLYVSDHQFWYLSSTGIYLLKDDRWIKIHSGSNLTAMTFKGDSIAVGTTDGYYVIDRKGKIVEPHNNRLPVPFINHMLTVDGKYWFATDQGAFVKQTERFDYYASKRWLDQDKIIDMTTDNEGNLYFLTPTGLNKMQFVQETLAGKAEFLQNNLRKYHLRYGFHLLPA